MKLLLSVASVLCLLFSSGSIADERSEALEYDPSPEHPFGRPNPQAPSELAQFAFMIGKNNCSEERLNSASGEWERSERTWDAHYFLNGYGIFDSGKSTSSVNSNARIFDTVSNQWQVTFFSMPVYGSGVWKGGLEGNNIVLKQAQKAPGTQLDGFSRLTFSNIGKEGFDWAGEWVSEDGSIVFPFWRISCEKS